MKSYSKIRIPGHDGYIWPPRLLYFGVAQMFDYKAGWIKAEIRRFGGVFCRWLTPDGRNGSGLIWRGINGLLSDVGMMRQANKENRLCSGYNGRLNGSQYEIKALYVLPGGKVQIMSKGRKTP